MATIVVPLGFYGCGDMKYEGAMARPMALSNIWDARTMAEMGELYKKRYPGENTVQKLVGLLSEGAPIEKNGLSETLTSRIEEDFRTGRTLTLDGWILSVTEARQCALFSLAQPK